jgi:putative ABC transport system permease protein
MHALLSDLRQAVRVTRHHAGFSAAAVATLALGIGVTTAIGTIVQVVLFEPLPYRDSRHIALVRATQNQSLRFALSVPEMLDLKRDATSIEDVAAYAYWSANVSGEAVPERAQAYRVTANTFALLGVQPLLGRTFVEADGRPGAPDVAIISHGLWVRRFASDPHLVGREIRLDGRPYTIVGVMPARFEFPVFNFKGDLWAPMPIDAAQVLANRASMGSAVVLARVRDDVALSAAQAEVDGIMARLARQFPDTNRDRGARLTVLEDLDDEGVAAVVAVFAIAAGAVLLLACANVTNLLLARGTARHRELAVRKALGATRTRVVRQLMVESLLLATIGGLCGVVLATVALSLVRAALPEIAVTTMPNLDLLGVNPVALAVATGATILTTIVSGIVPALRASRVDAIGGLREGAAAGAGKTTRRLRAGLVVAEVTLSTALAIIAGLLVSSYREQRTTGPGFNPANVLTLAISLTEDRYPPERRVRFFAEAAERIGKLGGIEAAGFVNVLPFSTYDRSGVVSFEGRAGAGDGVQASIRVVTADYLVAMRIPLLSGRGFDSRDRSGSAPVALVNDALVRTHFSGRTPIGTRVRMGRPGADAPIVEIVGVIGSVAHDRITAAPAPEIYLALGQSSPSMMMLAARTAGEPLQYAAAVRHELAQIDADQPAYHVKALDRLVQESMAASSSAAGMMTLFSALALALSAGGVYSVVSYTVNQQRRELGVRCALGARRNDLVRGIFRRSAMPVVAGLLLGVLGAAGTAGLIANLLHGVNPWHAPTYLEAAGLTALIGLAACLIPAVRASRVDPVVALRID